MIAIWIDYEPVSEGQDIIDGARIIDIEERGCWVMADVSDIDAKYDINGGCYIDEFWGNKTLVEEVEYTIRKCTWMGHKILNADDVVDTLEEMYA
ncbi:MAG: hypothetical protein Unbinned8622contig1005_54 [Prokaryotic dsDNA virus sp.]|nr:MAG: hypothetical protein Unbinned8622contig1005_54 [Prokaryotic dsDNA virus sp.]|tara:strand:+ start:3079 stop:3363 length:285 start_codon:yes stop_codon:yes gene_type:complete